MTQPRAAGNGPSEVCVVYWSARPIARTQLLARIRDLPGLALRECTTLAEVLAALPVAEGLILNDLPEAEARPVVEALRQLGCGVRWLHFLAPGYDGFEAAGLKTGRMAITYGAGSSAPTVAEHALAMLLALARRLPDACAQQAQARWDRSLAAGMTSLEGKTLVILGFGAIGQEVARRARAFGMRMVAVSRLARARRQP